MVQAANAALLDTAERQRSPAMRAKLVKHADLAVGVPEDDQPLAKQRKRARDRNRASGSG